MSKQTETMYPKILKIMEECTEKGLPYCKVGPVCTLFREAYPEHYEGYKDPQLTCRNNVQGRLSEMVSDNQWPVACRNAEYLKDMGYPDHTALYYLTDRPEPPPPCDDSSDVA